MLLRFIVDLVRNPVKKKGKVYYRYTVTIPSLIVKQFLADVDRFEMEFNGEVIVLKPVRAQPQAQ